MGCAVLVAVSRFLSVATVLFVVLCLTLTPDPARAFRNLAEGDRPADFSLATLDGTKVQLSKTLGKKATVIVFWASWSPRSSEALCDFCDLYEAHATDGLSVIAVDVFPREWKGDALEELVSGARQLEVPFPIVVDDDLEVFDAYGVVVLPAMVLLDAEGVVVALLSGYRDAARAAFRGRVIRELGAAIPSSAAGGSP